MAVSNEVDFNLCYVHRMESVKRKMEEKKIGSQSLLTREPLSNDSRDSMHLGPLFIHCIILIPPCPSLARELLSFPSLRKRTPQLNAIVFLISAIALPGFKPFGQVREQFKMVWHRYRLMLLSSISLRSALCSSRESASQR